MLVSEKVKNYILLFIVLSISLQCNKSSRIGSDLLSDEWINAAGEEYFNIKFSPFQQDSIIFASPGFPSTFYLGHVLDPNFGKYDSEIYTQLFFGVTRELDFLQKPVDSVVISVRYDTASFFGNPNATQNVTLHLLKDTLISSQFYYKNVKLNYNTEPIGSTGDFIPNLKDSVKFKIGEVEYGYGPQLRFALDTGKFMSLLRSFPDSAYSNLNYFNSLFLGLALVSTGNESLLPLSLPSSESRITIFYKLTDTTQAQFVFNFGIARISSNNTDPQNSKVMEFVNGQLSADSLGFIQGFGGTDVKIQIPYDSSWSEKLINYAVLELSSPVIPGDNTNYFKRPTLLNLRDVSNGRPSNIIDSDFGISFNNTTDYIRYFGGSPQEITENNEIIYKYKFNITGYFTQKKKAKKDLDFIVTLLSKSQSPNRLIIGGSKNQKYLPKLKLVLSD